MAEAQSSASPRVPSGSSPWVDDLHAAAAGADAVVITSRGQNPTGDALDASRADELAQLLGQYLRVAVLLGDPDTIDRVRGRQSLGPGWVSELLQSTVLHLLHDPKATNQIHHARNTYQARRSCLIEACAARDIPAFGSAGFNVWIPVNDETTATTTLLTAGWAVSPGNRYRQRTPPGIRITTADLDRHEAEKIADTLASLRQGHPRRTG